MTKFSDIRGMKVVDWEGTIIGKVKDIDMNLINNSVQSIVVHQGFFKHDTKVMMEYIDKVENNMLFLKITPVTKLVGKKVFGAGGEEIGKITEVVRVGETNVLKDIVVKMKVTITKGRGEYNSEKPLPGERKPAGEMRRSAESPLMTPSSDIEISMPTSNTETFKEEFTIPSKFVDSIGEHITLKLTKEELITEFF